MVLPERKVLLVPLVLKVTKEPPVLLDRKVPKVKKEKLATTVFQELQVPPVLKVLKVR